MQAIPAPLSVGRPIPGATAGSILFAGTSGVLAQDNANFKWGTTAGQGLTAKAGTAASAVSAFELSQTWNYSTAAITGVKWIFTDTLSHADTTAFEILGGPAGTTSLFRLSKRGGVFVPPDINLYGSNGTGFFPDNAGAYGMNYYSGLLGFMLGNAYPRAGFDANTYGFRLGPDYAIQWNSLVGLWQGSNDTSISRLSAGLLVIGTGAVGSFAGRLKLTSTIAAGVAIAALNAAPTAGEVQSVTDALAPAVGAAVAAGGAAFALVCWNGAQWTVIGI